MHMASKTKRNVLSDLKEEELEQNNIASEEENTLDKVIYKTSLVDASHHKPLLPYSPAAMV